MSSLRNSYAKIANQPKRPLFITLTENGDGVTYNIIGDYSVVESRFYFECPENDSCNIQGFAMHISGATNIKRIDYGDISGGLINGFDWYVRVGGVESIITPVSPIKTNEDLMSLGNDLQIMDFGAGEASHLFSDDLTFSDGFGLLLPGDRMGVIMRDDFSIMLHHEFHLTAWNYGAVSRP